MFQLNMAGKCTLAVTKNLVWGVIFAFAPQASHFLMTNLSFVAT